MMTISKYPKKSDITIVMSQNYVVISTGGRDLLTILKFRFLPLLSLGSK
jgi:hypothetical protein